MKNKFFYWVLLFFLLGQINILYSQNFRYGVPLHKTFTPYDYKGFPQVWSIDEMPDGNMVIATSYNIYFYDGNTFNDIISQGLFVVRVAKAYSGNKIYIGGDGKFGYLEKDSVGRFRRVFLSDSLPDSINVRSILNIFIHGDTVLFGDLYGAYEYINDKFCKFLKISNYVSLMHVDDKTHKAFYFRHRKLYEYKGGEFVLLKNFKNVIIYGFQNVMVEKNNLLFVGKSPFHNGIFRYDVKKDTLIPIKTSIDSIFDNYDATIFYKLNDGRYVVSLIGLGLVFLNRDFSVYSVFDRNGGLPDTYCNWVYQDSNSNIWVGTSNGFSVIYYGTNIFYYPSKKMNINTILLGGIVINKNKAIVGTANSLYSFLLKKNINTEKQFIFHKKLITNTSIQRLLDIGDNKVLSIGPAKLLCVNTKKNKVFDLVPNGFMGFNGFRSFFDEKIYYIQRLLGGLGVVRKDSNECSFLGFIKFPQVADIAIELDTNKIGIYNNINGFYSVSFDKKTLEVKNIKQLDKDGFNWVFRLNDTIYAIKFKKLKDTILSKTYYYSNQDTFLLAPFSFKFVNVQDEENVLDQYITFKRDSTYLVSINTFLHFVKILGKNIYLDKREFLSVKTYKISRNYYDKTNKLYWFYTPDIIYNIPYDFRLPKQKMHVFVRSIVIGNDSLAITNGALYPLTLDYKYNSIAFNFSAPYFLKNKEIEYKYMLYPIDKEWSEYSTNNYTRYTNLPPGNYVFKLKAKNIYGDESNVYEYKFTVLPPWYMTWWAYLLYTVLSIIVIYLIVRYYTYRLKRKNIVLEKIVANRTKEIRNKNEELSQKNRELFVKNKQITESIEYAKKIQEAIIPNENELKKIFPKSFVLFRPRDIVSGDFFWVHRINEQEKIVALADCTGHGVPGAFMSIIGNTLLNKIVKERGEFSPSNILSLLHSGVVDALQKDNEGDAIAEDGMDVIVCKIDERNKKLVVASANQTGFFYLDGKFVQVYGDPFAIGDPFARQEQIYFSSSEFWYKKEAMLYFTSDGYYDQFGGEGGNKKFTMKRFIELLDSIKDYDVEKQRAELEKVLDEWKNGTMQLDDILVIGIQYPKK